jgi:hypothetical protein
LSDLNAIKQRVKGYMEGSETIIPDETIELFCKNASNIRVVQYKSLAEDYIQPEKQSKLAYY